MSHDYTHENSQRLEKWLADLRERLKLAEQEAQHARSLHLDLGGPIRAAEAEIKRLSTQIIHAERLIERVQAGYPYWERHGFEDAIDAAGETWSWQTLSAVPAPGTILGYDDVAVRLPVRVQKAYAHAVATQLFEGFEICSSFDTSDEGEAEGPIRNYLFGTIQSIYHEDQGGEIFLIDTWDEN